MYWLGRGSFGLLSLTLLFLLFPTGKPFSRRWGWVGWIAAVRSALSIPVSAIAPDPIGTFPFSTELVAASDSLRMVMKTPKIYLDLVDILCLGAGLISLVVRLIRAKGVERQQLKWFLFPVIFYPLAILLIVLGGRYLPPEFSWMLWVGAFFGVTAGTSMAATSAIAIFRYRMWDIDIIIHRTLVYGLLSSLLVFIYFSSVVLFQQVLQALTGQGSTPAVVISTLMVVAIFTPLRRRIQDFIDRRFYRRKYNAEKIMAAWNAGIRDEVDIDQLSLRLVGVVEETLQPERVSLWLKKHKRKK